MERASDGGAAAFCAAARYQTGCDGTVKDLTQALCCYVTAAAAGHADARQALWQDFAAEEHLDAAARLPQVHETAVQELTRSQTSSTPDSCAGAAQLWQSWLADVERRRFFAEDVALGDRNQQLARLVGCIAADAAPPCVALVWLLVDLIDAHAFPALAHTGGPALLQYINSTTVVPDLQAAACTLLAVLAECEPAPVDFTASVLWQNTATALVELLHTDSGRCDSELTTVSALECLMMPCVLPHTDPHRLATILKRSVLRPGRIFEKACCCVYAAIATGNLDTARALISIDVAQELFSVVEKHCPRVIATQQEAEHSHQDVLLVTFQALRALLSTGALDGRLACVAETLIGTAIRFSLQAVDHPICHEAFLLLLEGIARPWPVFETSAIQFVAHAVLDVIELPDSGPDGTRRLITAFRAFVAWLPQSDWDMIPLFVAAARTLEKQHATASACAEWCVIATPRINEWTAAQLSDACDCVVRRSPTWLARQDHPEAAVAVILLWSELLKHACACVEPSGANIVRSLVDMLDQCGGLQCALKLAVDFEQAAHLVAQVARARHYPDLECRQHSSDASGQYLSLLVQAHVTPRLCYTHVGVRSAFEKSDYPQQALLVDTWTSLDLIPQPSLVLINAALEQASAVLCQEGLAALPFGVLFRLIWLCQHATCQPEVGDRFVEACNRGLQNYRGLSTFLSDIPTELTDEVMLWLFTRTDKEVLSTLFIEWLSNRDSPVGHTTPISVGSVVENWMLSSTRSVQFALHLLSDATINGDLESDLLDFLLVSLELGGTDSLTEMCTHGMRPLTRILRSCVQDSQMGTAFKCLQLLKQSLKHGLYNAGGHERRCYSDQLVPLVGAVGTLLSANLSIVYDEAHVTRMTSDMQRAISGCVECLFLAVEGVPNAAVAVVVAMRPGADGAVGSQMHMNLFKLLHAASQMEIHDEDVLAAVAGSISLFISLLQKDGKYYYHQHSTASNDTGKGSYCLLSDALDLELINDLLHFLPPTVGALACTWLAASWQLKREEESVSATVGPRTANTTRLPSAHPELHMQLLNLALVGNMSATSLIPVSAAFCLEELYACPEPEISEKQTPSALLHGWPSHVARVARDALMCRISCSLEQEQMPSTDNRAAATEAAELVAASKFREPGPTEMFSSLSNAEAEGATARVLAALIARWPSIAPDLFESTDTAAVIRHVAKLDEHIRPAFRPLVSAFAELGLTAPSEKQEALACVYQIDQYRQSLLADQMATVVWIPAVQNGLTIPVGRSCRTLCERTSSGLWSSAEAIPAGYVA